MNELQIALVVVALAGFLMVLPDVYVGLVVLLYRLVVFVRMLRHRDAG